MKTKPTRIIFTYLGKFYKFMNYFTDNKDNSFYFHVYEDSSHKIKIPISPLEKREDNIIDFMDFVETDFKRNKLSFHQSGYIHSTDNYGNRFQEGVIGMPFNKIDKSLLIVVFCPKRIDSLIEIEKPNLKTDLLIALPPDIEPFTVHFDVYRKNKVLDLDVSIPNILFGGYVLTEYDDKEFGLRIYFQKVLGNAVWPPFNFIIKRIG